MNVIGETIMNRDQLYARFFSEIGRGTVSEIHKFLVDNGETFACKSGNENDERKSVNRQISRKVGQSYPTGILKREKNCDGIFEYYTVKK